MSNPKVLITHWDVPEIAMQLLGAKCELIINQDKPYPTKEQLLKQVKGVDGIFWIAKNRLDADILDAAGPQLKVIATMSVGVDHIDVAEVKKRGIKLGNTPRVLDDSVAELAVCLALAAARRTHEGRKHIENGTWAFSVQWLLGRDLKGSTVGIVGLGRIGQAIVKRLKSFQVAKFLYTGHHEKPEGNQLGAQFVSLDNLLKNSDFVICAVPLTPETKEMFNESLFLEMKNTAIFVNISRGDVVKQDDMIKALENGEIFAAGIDVMTPEPLPKDHKLLTLPNCVITPHVGSATMETRNTMAELTAKNILRGLGGGELFTPVN